jgi:hypothetical protein
LQDRHFGASTGVSQRISREGSGLVAIAEGQFADRGGGGETIDGVRRW